MTNLPALESISVNNKTVLLRVDLNVPMLHNKVEDATRIMRILPTINYLLEQNAKVVLLSHFGRPKGEFVRSMSLAPLVDEFTRITGKEIKFAVDCIGSAARDAVAATSCGELILMENLRFYAGEEQNDETFAQELASLGDVYVNDTFSCSHRAHASIVGLPKLMPSAAGFLMREEISTLENILGAAKLPMAAIVGGAKVSTKLELLYSLLNKVKLLVIGGAMGNTFLKAMGQEIGKSYYEEALLPQALEVIKIAAEKDCELILPIDVVVAAECKEKAECRVITLKQMDSSSMILDVGPKTVALITDRLERMQTLVWNGPMGAFEYKPFDIGTTSLARDVAELTNSGRLISVAGGGDIVSALSNSGLSNNFTYISTAGGAFLEWLEGKSLPGIDAILT
jgi:phosphoglycerate kinase